MNPIAPAAATAKAERFNIRADHDEKALVEQAARASHMTMSQFVLQAALRSAEEVLADPTRFVLTVDQWEAFSEALDRPARLIPELEQAASKPTPFSER